MRASLLLTAPLLLLLVACSGSGSSTAEDPAPSAVSADTLDGSWAMTGVSTKGSASDAVPHIGITLAFESGQVRASAGCNSMTGSATVVDGRLEVADLASTEIGCPEQVAETERWLAGFLKDRPAVSVDGDAMTLETDGASLDLARVPAATPTTGSDDGGNGVVGHAG